MVQNIHQVDTLKNMGIDKNMIDQVGQRTEEPIVIEPPVQIKETPERSKDEELEFLKKEILSTTYGQLVDLANQFKKFADDMEVRLDKIEAQVANLQQAPKAEPKEQQEKLPVQEPKGENIAPTDTSGFSENDVSIEKMFNFSNTK